MKKAEKQPEFAFLPFDFSSDSTLANDLDNRCGSAAAGAFAF